LSRPTGPPHRDIGTRSNSIGGLYSQCCSVVGLVVLGVHEGRHQSIPYILVDLQALLDDTLILRQQVAHEDLLVAQLKRAVDGLLFGVGQEHDRGGDEHRDQQSDHQGHEDREHNVQPEHFL
jgi:hypothetical protein